MSTKNMTGPLKGVRVIEMAGIGPSPFCAMMLADMGAEVIRIDRVGSRRKGPAAAVDRGKRTLRLNLKNTEAVSLLLDLVNTADVLIEGFRPGVMERLSLGPDVCLERNGKLVYGRMTGWGQAGPLSQAAGHDLNYIAITGALHATGYRDRPPTPPLHLVGDLAGGAMMLAYGIACALLEARQSGKGQVIDGAICDGVALLSTSYQDPNTRWNPERESNYLDGGAPFYGCYRCADDRFVSVGAIEPQFYALLLSRCGMTDPDFEDQWNRAQWPLLRKKMEGIFLRKTRAQWCDLLEGSDACFAPVLTFEEARQHPHNQARETYLLHEGRPIPAPAPRLQRTPATPGSFTAPEGFVDELLSGLGRTGEQIEQLRTVGALD